MRIVTLVENVVCGGTLSAEHGLSLYIEHGGHRILFDTGQGDRFLKNAGALGIDIAEVEALVVSHGHYDHAGGIEAFCRANARAPIFVKEGFFEPKYNKNNKFIGIQYNRELYDGRLRVTSHPQEIFPGVHLVTDIPLVNAWDTHFDNLFVVRNGRLELDPFSDEQFLVFPEDDGLIVISGCSHRGITNILSAAAEAFPSKAARRKTNTSVLEAATARPERGPVFKLVVGGFHLYNADSTTVDHVIHAMEAFRIERLGCCHCTGVEHYVQIKSVFGERAFYGWTGIELEL